MQAITTNAEQQGRQSAAWVLAFRSFDCFNAGQCSVPQLLQVHQRVHGLGHEMKNGKVVSLLLHSVDPTASMGSSILVEVSGSSAA